MDLIKIGTRFINLNHVSSATVSDDETVLSFNAANENGPVTQTFKGAEAEALRRFLEKGVKDILTEEPVKPGFGFRPS